MIYLIYSKFLYIPLLNILIGIYNMIPSHDMGLAIIVLTVLIRLALYPLQSKAIKSQTEMQKIQPEIQKIREKFKNNKEQQSRELMGLYKTHKINPLSGCLPILIQLPILFAIYSVFRMGLNASNLHVLYPFINKPEVINTLFLGFFDLSKQNLILAIIAGVSQFFQSKMLFTKQKKAKKPGNDFASVMNQQMVYIMPFMTFYICLQLPAGLALYWLTTNLFAIIQQYFIIKKKAISPQNEQRTNTI